MREIKWAFLCVQGEDFRAGRGTAGENCLGEKTAKRQKLAATLLLVIRLSHYVLLFETSRTAARQDSLSITKYQSLLKLMSMESVMPSNHHLLSSCSLPALNLSQHQGLFR